MQLKSLEDTQNFSKNISKIVSAGDIIFLYGEIGVGKTTFVQFFINHLESKNRIKNSEVLSPTFNIVYDYDVGDIKILHYDLFRLKNYKDISKLVFLSISFLPVIFWKFFCYSKGIGDHYINTNILLNLLPRLDDLNNYKLISYFLFLNEKFLVALIFFLVSFWIKLDKELFSFIFVVTAMYIFILFFIYLSTPFDFYWQLDSTAARVIKSLSFLLAFFGLYNLSNGKIKTL